MRRTLWILLPLILSSTGGARSQELRGFLTLDSEVGYLTNPYLDPSFASWSTETEAPFGSLGATGILEWSGAFGSASLLGAARWKAFTDSTPTWNSYLLQAGVEGRPASRLAVRADASFSNIGEPSARRTYWGQASLRWTVSSRLRFSLGPGLVQRRFTEEEAVGAPVVPPGPGTSQPGTESASTATSVTLFAGVEAWPGPRWQLRAEGYGSQTDASDVGIEYGGLGGSLRLTRWLRDGAFVAVGAGVESYGYRAAAEGDPSTEVPEDDLIWRGDLTVGWPVGRHVELRGRLAVLTRSGTAEADGFDHYTSIGLRIALGGILSPGRESSTGWTRTADGLHLRLRYEGPGRLYLVGDFNEWADPGLPLWSEAGDLHSATLRLEPGRYEYRIRVVEGDSVRWLDLPEGTLTVDDGFGGENGLLVVGVGEGGGP